MDAIADHYFDPGGGASLDFEDAGDDDCEVASDDGYCYDAFEGIEYYDEDAAYAREAEEAYWFESEEGEL